MRIISKSLAMFFAAAAALAVTACAQAKKSERDVLLEKKAAALAYIKSVADGDKYLSGQRNNGTDGHIKDWEKLEKETGKLPAILCAEYCTGAGGVDCGSAEEAMQWRAMNAIIEDHWKNGGLVTITFHFPNPYNEKFNGLRQKIKDGGAAITTDVTPERARWFALLDEVAKGVKGLNAKGIIPELRPLHESNGAWFWWGSYLPPTVQQKLEDDFFDAVESAGGVAVWHKSWAGLVGGVYRPERYDIVGFDAYDKHARDLSCVKDLYSKTLASGKLFILSEFGPHYPGDNKGKKLEPFDCSDIIPGMDANCPRSLGAVWWAGPWSITNNRNSKEYMNSPRVITLGQVSYKGR